MQGYLFEYSVLFYGYYDSGQNETYFAPPHNSRPYIGGGYKLPLAYILVIMFIFVISGGAILYRLSMKLGVKSAEVELVVAMFSSEVNKGILNNYCAGHKSRGSPLFFPLLVSH